MVEQTPMEAASAPSLPSRDLISDLRTCAQTSGGATRRFFEQAANKIFSLEIDLLAARGATKAAMDRCREAIDDRNRAMREAGMARDDADRLREAIEEALADLPDELTASQTLRAALNGEGLSSANPR